MEPELSPELIIQADKSQKHAVILSEIADEETEGGIGYRDISCIPLGNGCVFCVIWCRWSKKGVEGLILEVPYTCD